MLFWSIISVISFTPGLHDDYHNQRRLSHLNVYLTHLRSTTMVTTESILSFQENFGHRNLVFGGDPFFLQFFERRNWLSRSYFWFQNGLINSVHKIYSISPNRTFSLDASDHSNRSCLCRTNCIIKTASYGSMLLPQTCPSNADCRVPQYFYFELISTTKTDSFNLVSALSTLWIDVTDPLNRFSSVRIKFYSSEDFHQSSYRY